MTTRTEQDFIGEVQLPAGVLYGIHALRAVENFPGPGRFDHHWYRAIGTVKQGCYETYAALRRAVLQDLPGSAFSGQMISDEVLNHLIQASTEVAAGEHFDHFIVPPLCGGAGTSINMNVNEIIANRALILAGLEPGTYDRIDPFTHANIYQSTNDVIPTSLRIAAMQQFTALEHSVNGLRFAIEEKEKEYRNVMRIGYTQMQAAVPSSYGMLFSNYSDALSRDWWRISRCMERLKVVNIGGSAIGTGMAVPRYFIMEVIQVLRQLTGLPLTRSENMGDATSNLDVLVEVHAILKALAVTLQKMSSDLRLLASDLTAGEVRLPNRQVGSSVMPGKVNPVIPEYIITLAHRVYANDQTITALSAQGCLDLNPYLPVIGDALLNSLELLNAGCLSLRDNLITGLTISTDTSTQRLYTNAAVTTALLPLIGYHQAAQLAHLMKTEGISVFEANQKLNLVNEEVATRMLAPQELLKLGFSIKEISQHEQR
jgi:aspartate ammonia-lyase